MAVVSLGEYNTNPAAYVGRTTKFNGKFVSKEEIDAKGSFDALVELDFALSGAYLTEPIHIIAESQNAYKDEIIAYEGKDTVLEFEVEILQKPPGIHKFKLIKTLWAREGFVSHSARKGAGAQQTIPQITQQPQAAPPAFPQKAGIPQQIPGASYNQQQLQPPVYGSQQGAAFNQQPQTTQWNQQGLVQQGYSQLGQFQQSGQMYNSAEQPQMQYPLPGVAYQQQQGAIGYGQPQQTVGFGQAGFQGAAQAYPQNQLAYGQQYQQGTAYQQQQIYGQGAQAGFIQGAQPIQQGYTQQQTFPQQGQVYGQQRAFQPPQFGQQAGFQQQPQYQQNQFQGNSY